MVVAAIDCEKSFWTSIAELGGQGLIQNVDGGFLILPLDPTQAQTPSETVQKQQAIGARSIVVQTVVRLDGGTDVIG